jgi:hypothetical protein
MARLYVSGGREGGLQDESHDASIDATSRGIIKTCRSSEVSPRITKCRYIAGKMMGGAMGWQPDLQRVPQ